MGTFEHFEKAISYERFGRYLAWSDDDRDAALLLYAQNTRLSEALYTPLQTLEVVLRNRVHAVLSERAGKHWFHSDLLIGPYQTDRVQAALEELLRANKTATPGSIVASLTFSFWTTMFNRDYEALWQQALHRIADPSAPRGLKRKSFSGPLTRIRLIRNRIAHHEPIVGWDLPKHHARMMELIGWLSPPAAAWCRAHDRFPDVASRISSRYSLPASASARDESRSAVP